MVFIISGLYAFFQYSSEARQKPICLPWKDRQPGKAMVVYILIVLMMIFRDYQVTGEGWGSLNLLIRILPFYALFFVVPAFVTCATDLAKLIRVLVFVCMIGNAIIIVQSLHGPGGLFGGLLGQIVTPPGPQITMNFGSFYRSNFPVYFACVWCFFYYLSRLSFKPRLGDLLLVFFFSFSFLLNMARGLYFGIVLAVIVFTFALFRQRKLFVRLAVLLPVLVASVIYVAPVLGLSDLNEAVVTRVTGGLEELQYQAGTWGGRLNQLEVYRGLRPDIVYLLTGYGYRGTRSGIAGLTFIEFGLIDPVYRSGIIGAILLVWIIATVIGFALRSFRDARTPLLAVVSLAILCSLVSEIGHLPSANHFYYHYYAAVIGTGVAIALVGRKAWGDT